MRPRMNLSARLAVACLASACVAQGASPEWLALEAEVHTNSTGVLGPTQTVGWSEQGTLIPQIPQQWRHLDGPIGTVCITGDDRVGKSTLLTMWAHKLAGPSPGAFAFPSASNSPTSQTKGLWSAIIPAELTGLDYHLNLCDSQGLKQVPEVEQWRLFSANVFVPSVLVYMLLNLPQHDQIRDLAHFARQFQQLSTEDFGRFGKLLSPHLVVLVRDESDLCGSEGSVDCKRHFEDMLESPGHKEEKDLIANVFQKREVLTLQQLPTKAIRTLRQSIENGKVNDNVPGGEEWRQSGEAVLKHVLEQLQTKRAGFLRGGAELAEWYRSVAVTVNSESDRALERFIGHSERLFEVQWRRQFLQEWGYLTLGGLLGVATLFLLGGCLGKWLDRTFWCAWLVCCVCYVGSSPLVTTQLDNLFLSQYCEHIQANLLTSFWQAACREASAHTAAVFVSLIFGAVSYKVIIGHLHVVLGMLWKMPRTFQLSVALVVVCILMAGVFLVRSSLDLHTGGEAGVQVYSLAAVAVLVTVVVHTSVELAAIVYHNRTCAQASQHDRDLHFWISARIEEVRILEDSPQWAAHYRRHSPLDAIWRYRRQATNRQVLLCSQACALLMWAFLIFPHCEGLLASGATANLLHLLWRLWAALCCGCRRERSVAEWLNELEEDEAKSLDEASDAEAVQQKNAAQLLPETEEEIRRRYSIESMRQAQGSHDWLPWLRRRHV